MTRRPFNLVTPFAALCVLVVSACTQQRSPCYEPKLVSVAMGSYRMVDTAAVDTALLNPSVGCVDTFIPQVITVNNRFGALLSPYTDSTRWYIIPNDSTLGNIADEADTITFYHTNTLNFISNACGYVYYFTLTSVKTTYHSIDSISLVNTSVDNNASTQHLRIFY
jgi:hypothetical protein